MTKVEKRLELAYKSSLVGANLERVDLRGLDLRGINLTSANLRGADLTGANLSHATLIRTDLSRANLHKANFTEADLTGCDLTATYGRGTVFYKTKMCGAYLRYAQYKNAFFIECDLTGADFLNSLFLGAKFDGSDTEGVKNADRAIYTWWWSPLMTGKISYDPLPGWYQLDESVTGVETVRENAAREHVEQSVEKSWDMIKGEVDAAKKQAPQG